MPTSFSDITFLELKKSSRNNFSENKVTNPFLAIEILMEKSCPEYPRKRSCYIEMSKKSFFASFGLTGLQC